MKKWLETVEHIEDKPLTKNMIELKELTKYDIDKPLGKIAEEFAMKFNAKYIKHSRASLLLRNLVNIKLSVFHFTSLLVVPHL